MNAVNQNDTHEKNNLVQYGACITQAYFQASTRQAFFLQNKKL
jgi:hypothetical protein